MTKFCKQSLYYTGGLRAQTVAHSKADFFTMRAAMNMRTTPNGTQVKPSNKTTNLNPTGGLVVKCEISVELSRGHDNTLRSSSHILPLQMSPSNCGRIPKRSFCCSSMRLLIHLSAMKSLFTLSTSFHIIRLGLLANM